MAEGGQSRWQRGQAHGLWDGPAGPFRRLSNIKAIVFDKDGTLFSNDEMDRLWATTIASNVSRKTGVPESLVYKVLEFDAEKGRAIPSGLLTAEPWPHIAKVVVDHFNPQITSSTAKLNMHEILDWIQEVDHKHQKPIFDITKCMECLQQRGFKLGVCTNDTRHNTIQQLDFCNISHFFAVVVCPDDGIPPKPSGDMASHLATSLGVTVSQLCIVGDSMTDVHLATKNGAISVAVLSGSSNIDNVLPEAHVVLDDASSLPDFLAAMAANDN